MEQLIPWISGVGFPIAVAAYLLVRVEGSIKDLSREVRELRGLLVKMNGKV